MKLEEMHPAPGRLLLGDDGVVVDVLGGLVFGGGTAHVDVEVESESMSLHTGEASADE